MSEYLHDRLNEQISELEAEVEQMQKMLHLYRDMEKDRVVTEVAVFVVGLLTGVALGFYTLKGVI